MTPRQWICGVMWGHNPGEVIRTTATGRVFRCRDCGVEVFISKWDRD